MDDKQYNRVIASLVAFVERATSEKATEEEVRVLPAVASVLLDDVWRQEHQGMDRLPLATMVEAFQQAIGGIAGGEPESEPQPSDK